MEESGYPALSPRHQRGANGRAQRSLMSRLLSKSITEKNRPSAPHLSLLRMRSISPSRRSAVSAGWKPHRPRLSARAKQEKRARVIKRKTEPRQSFQPSGQMTNSQPGGTLHERISDATRGGNGVCSLERRAPSRAGSQVGSGKVPSRKGLRTFAVGWTV